MVKDATELDLSFAALSHPVRRTIVERLARGSGTVGETTHDLPVSKPAISKHLRVLEDAGVVVRAVQGRTHRLTLDQRPLARASTWMDRQRELWERKLDIIGDYLEETK
jgi:DNA-binding transcriptional ArsR family regulator